MSDGYTARFPQRLRVLFAVASVVVSGSILVFTAKASYSPAAAVAVVLIAVQAAGFWWLGGRPAPAATVVLAAGAGMQVLYPVFGPGLAFVALCTYAWLRPAARTWWILAAAVAAASGPAVARGRWDLAGLWAGAALLAWSWGAWARARGARRVAERRRAVLEERARIARELHDVLSHTVSVMVVQAAAADDIFDLDPVRAREGLRRTEQAGREALAELRHFLRTVRGDEDKGDEDGDGAADEPQPRLSDLDRLAATMRESGLDVSVVWEGDGAVPAGVQVGAYRIVREALTNTLRHAGASRAEVLVRVAGDEVMVRVRDDGAGGGGSAVKDGHGLLGMRERAGLLGGSLRAGRRPDGGFEVEAHLPLRGTP
ncbi:histidine kinase [Actinoplanes sp. NPDC051470]|uniref:sensor histidine kinase n=1 Tax=Actinoplanes sp. NPDC051470 TaxID=3157224 RepID=UPI0034372D22